MTVRKVAAPASGLLREALVRVDYVGAYASRLPATVDAEQFARAFMASPPGWVDGLLRLRDRLVGWIGLKTADAGMRRERPPVALVPGESAGVFRTYAVTDDEILMGEDDRHLDFRVSFLVQERAGRRWGVVTTVVQFHGWLGRAYFVPVRPFHALIVPAMLRRAVRQLR